MSEGFLTRAKRYLAVLLVGGGLFTLAMWPIVELMEKYYDTIKMEETERETGQDGLAGEGRNNPGSGDDRL